MTQGMRAGRAVAVLLYPELPWDSERALGAVMKGLHFRPYAGPTW